MAQGQHGGFGRALAADRAAPTAILALDRRQGGRDHLAPRRCPEPAHA